MSDKIRVGLGEVLAEIPVALPPSQLPIASEIKIMVSRVTRHTHTQKGHIVYFGFLRLSEHCRARSIA